MKAAVNSLVPKHAGKPCPYCNDVMGEPYRLQPTREHVVPRSRGGANHASNILIACRRCNTDKSDLSLAEFYGWLHLRKDVRAAVVCDVIHASCAGDVDLLADFHCQAGIYLARHRLPGARQEKRVQRAMDAAWSVMAQFKVPRTHWRDRKSVV